MPNFYITDNVYQDTELANAPIVTESNPSFEARSVWSINASNQLQGTIWAVRNGELIEVDLVSAAYEFFDKTGAAIGLSQTGIAPNSESFFITTPVSAALLSDLSHYTVKLTVTTADEVITSVNSVTVAA